MACLSGCISKLSTAVMLIFLLFGIVSSVRVSEKMYEPIQGNMSCFKRFNGTAEFGCTSNFGGNVGVLYIPVNESDAKWAIESGPHPPYILGLKDRLFTRNILMSAKNSGNVNGILYLHLAENYPEQFSPASTCPTHDYGLYNYSSQSQYKDYCSAEQPWNSAGNSLLFESFDFPIFLIQEPKSIESIIMCYNEFNVVNNESNSVQWPLCALELYSNMFGTTNSEVCLRRRDSSVFDYVNYCDPIHDYNIIGSLNPMTSQLDDSSVIVVAARVDAGSLFNNISPGADSAVTGLVTLLAVAEALNKYKDDFDAAGKHVLFMLFEAETWDYLGSSTAAYDMGNGNFPHSSDENDADHVSQFNFSNIAYFIELSQVGIQGDQTTVYLHTDPISNSLPEIQEGNSLLNAALQEAGRLADVNVKIVGDETNGTRTPYPLPPASVQSFLKYKNISAAVLTDHEREFKNQYYQSFLDNDKNVDFKSTLDGREDSDKLHSHLQKIASTVSSAVYKIATNNVTEIIANGDLIGEMLVCFLRNVNCTLFRENSGNLVLDYPSYFQPTPAKMYNSVYRGEDILSNITLYLLGHFLGEEVPEDVHECWSNRTSAIQKFYMPILGNGTCFVSTARAISAVSPAFRIPDYDFSSGEYSTWTESGWSRTSARLFLKPDPAEEIGLVVGGVLLIIVTALISYWAADRANTLFECSPAPVHC